MLYKWGEDFIGDNFPKGGGEEFSQGTIFPGKILGVIFTGEILIRNQVLAKKKENYNLAHKMVEKLGKSWVLSVCVSRISHIID